MIKIILVPLDGGERSAQVLETALVVARRFDGLLAVVLAERSVAFDALCTSDLADFWWARRGTLEGVDLAALIWRVARDESVAVRALERKLLREIDPSRLFSRAQRARVFGR